MTIANTNVIAKVAAAVAGLALVAMSFGAYAPAKADTTTTTSSSTSTAAQIASLMAQIQALQAQLAGSQTTTASVTFTRDLTIGSTGTDVTALQNWLIAKGFTISAGATGFFGAQTKAALAAYQSANGISPAVGFFGPITRAKVNASSTTTTTTTTTTTGGTTTTTGGTTTLSGGEADLTDYQLNNESGLVHENDSAVKIATAQFDVTNGDVNVQRADLEFQATNTGLNVHPWQYIQSVSVWNGSTKLATMSAGNSSNWSDNNDDGNHSASSADVYKISLTGFNYIVKQNNTANLTFTVDAQSNIDTANLSQRFAVDVPDQGIRAMDAAGIQQYTGSYGDTVNVTFSGEQNGSLTVSEADDNPSASVLVAKSNNQSDTFTVLAFNIRNSDDASTNLKELMFDVATTSGTGNGVSGNNITSLIQQAQLTIGGQTYTANILNSTHQLDFKNLNVNLPADATTEGTIKVRLNSQAGNFNTSGTGFTVSLTGNTSNVDAEGLNSGDNSTVTGMASGRTQTVALSGIAVTNGSATVVSNPNNTDTTKSYATYTIGFDVAAVQNDAYIPNTTASSTAASTTEGVEFNRNAAGTFTGTSTATLTSSADLSAGFYRVPQGSTRHFTLTVTLDPLVSGQYEVDLTKVQFATTTSLTNLTTYNIDTNDSSFKTTPTFIQQ